MNTKSANPLSLTLSALFLIATGISLLAGCAADSQSTVINASRALVDAARDRDPFTRQDVDNVPYATIAARFGKRPKAMLVLGVVDGTHFKWYSADRAVLVTQHDFLVAAAGTPADIWRREFLSTSLLPMRWDARRAAAVPFRWRVDTATAFGIEVTCDVTGQAQEHIEVIERRISTVRYELTCQQAGERKRWKDHYWIDPRTDAVVRAKIQATNDSEKILIENLTTQATPQAVSTT